MTFVLVLLPVAVAVVSNAREGVRRLRTARTIATQPTAVLSARLATRAEYDEMCTTHDADRLRALNALGEARYATAYGVRA